jgi:Meckel syndrome type 1 protein
MLAAMPSTTLVGGLAAAFLLLVIVTALLRRKKAEPKAPVVQPPAELAAPPPPAERAPSAPPAQALPQPVPSAPPPAQPIASAPPPPAPTPEFPLPSFAPPAAAESPTAQAQSLPPDDLDEEAVVETTMEVEVDAPAKPAFETPTTPPPSVEASVSAAPGETESRAPRPQFRSYSNISDESVAEEVRLSQVPAQAPAAPAKPAEPVVARPAPKPVAPVPTFSRPAPAAPKVPPSDPKTAISVPKAPASEPKPAPAIPKPAPSEPKVTKPEPAPIAKPAPAPAAASEQDFSSLNTDTAAEKAKLAATAPAPRYVPPSNPATAELEKSDPRHAAARRLARLSVSEIKLYHEAEVTAGREAKDLWKRLQQDIGLARQTFEARVAREVRDRFDYLYDEILRQLAEGDASKLGPDAPKPKTDDGVAGPAAAASPTSTEAEDSDAPTATNRRTLEPVVPAPEPVAAAPAPAPAPAPSPAAAAAAAPAAAKPTGLAARAIASNPETAELEKNDPRHAAARRLARLSVSEIKLYHEDEVKAGREAKDLWKRMITDIGLATQTFEKRVDKEVRERFDYLYDEILRQLAEGDVSKLGPDAPKPKQAAAPAAAAPAPAAPAPPPSEPKAVPEPKASEPKVAASATPKAAEPAPKPAAAAPAAAASPAARFMPPSNPATAELEKSDPRHAAARRLARLSVSEIKLYHEDEVKAGREAKDLWKRLITDIGLATQTYEKRVDKEVRERFDYLYDEILRQLAEGDVAKLGADAPKPKDA